MNSWQHAQEIAYLLGAATWVDSPSEYVFGRRPSGVGSGGAVIVTDGPSADALKELRTPFALVSVGNSRPDDEHPDLILVDFDVIVVQQVEGDPLGERILAGGPRPAGGGQGSSRGRGILEIEERVIATCGRITGADGAPMALAYMGSPPSQRLDTGYMVGSRKYTFRAWCTRQAEYPAPTNLVATAGGGGVTLTWTLPPARWDRRRVILRRASGSTPPASATAGTGVTLSGDAATTVLDNPAAGVVSYAIFEAYSETGAAADERFSSQVTGTTRTVTAVAPFSPAQVTGLVGWFDFSDASLLFQLSNGTTAVASDGDPIGYATDKKSGFNLLQATAGFKPLYKTAVQNALAVARFDGSDDFLQVLGVSFGVQPTTIFIVVKEGDAQHWAFSGGDAGASQDFVRSVNVSGNDEIGAGNSWNGAAHTVGAFHVFECLFNGASSSITLDGALLAGAINAGAQVLSNGFTLGARFNGTGAGVLDVGEVAIIASASAGDLTNMRAWLKAKWGTP